MCGSGLQTVYPQTLGFLGRSWSQGTTWVGQPAHGAPRILSAPHLSVRPEC